MSMSHFEPTAAQRELIETPGSRFVEACPGAGKTQCIVERFVRRPGVIDRRGVALLSFTNAAIDEARKRCADVPELLRAPNFVGTIDSFINRYMVGPMYAATTGKTPTFKDTWDAVPGASFNVRGMNTSPFRLNWFSFDVDGKPTLEPARAPIELRNWLRGLSSREQETVGTEATKVWKRYHVNGIVDCSTSRALMVRYLNDPKKQHTLKYLLRNRFAEVIVDEVQDCSSSDVALIELFIAAGVSVVMVGDLDQSIYDFRGSTIDQVRSLVKKVPPGSRLNGNYRSSPQICGLVDSLRHGTATDVASGKWAMVTLPVHVLRVDNFSTVHDRIITVAEDAKIPASDVVVLAHAEVTARACAGAAAEPSEKSSSQLVRLARAVAQYRDASRPLHERTKAIVGFEAALKELADEQLHAVPDAAFLQTNGLNRRTLRDGALRLACLVNPFAAAPSVFKEALKDGLGSLGWSWANAGALRRPNGDVWPDVPKVGNGTLRWSTVHSFKGLQAPAVALAVPPPPKGVEQDQSGVGLWGGNSGGEPRRVLYVGASRAERLAMLLVAADQYDDVVTCLDRDQVAYVPVA